MLNIAGVVWASPYTLLGIFIGSIGFLFGGRVRVVGRAIEFYDGGIKWFIHQLPNGQFTLALTLGHVILGQTDAALDISRKHEAVHIAQYERWGPFMIPAYFLSSVYVWLAGKRFYRDNPFEREAYDVDRGGPRLHDFSRSSIDRRNLTLYWPFLVGFVVGPLQYLIEVYTHRRIPIEYCFPTYYRLDTVMRPFTHFDALYGCWVQYVFYGAVVAFAGLNNRLRLGLLAIIAFHMVSIFLCTHVHDVR